MKSQSQVSNSCIDRCISETFSGGNTMKKQQKKKSRKKSRKRHLGLVGSKAAAHLQRSCKQARYSTPRFNNQLPCEPLSNAEFCKVQLICYRNERLANCDSPQPVHPSVCLHAEPEGQ